MEISIKELVQAVSQTAENQHQPEQHTITGKHIVVLDRGFVYVGDCERSGDCLLIRNAKNIRKWGTTKGLGELCGGPTNETVADPIPNGVLVPWKSIIHLMPCNPYSW